MKRAWMIGLVVWALGTVLLRLGVGRSTLSARPVGIVALYLVSFGIMYALFRHLVFASRDASTGARAAIAVLLPTLVLDAFASAFFMAVYRNLPASAAGVFGGWILICCAGGLFAVLQRR